MTNNQSNDDIIKKMNARAPIVRSLIIDEDDDKGKADGQDQ